MLKDEFSIPYLAGFFDGEGSIGVYAGQKHGRCRFYLKVQLVQNTSIETNRLFDFIKLKYGGNSSLLKNTKRSTVHWQLGSNGAVRFLRDLSPHLNLKKQQAIVAIEWQEQRPPCIRNSKGHVVYKTEPVLENDKKVMALLKSLKEEAT